MCNSKTIRICRNHHVDFLRFLFTVCSLKIKRVWNYCPSHTFFIEFFIFYLFFCNITKTAQISLPDFAYFLSYSVKSVSCFTLRYLMTSKNLNIWKVKFWLSQERKYVCLTIFGHYALKVKCIIIYFSLGIQMLVRNYWYRSR